MSEFRVRRVAGAIFWKPPLPSFAVSPPDCVRQQVYGANLPEKACPFIPRKWQDVLLLM